VTAGLTTGRYLIRAADGGVRSKEKGRRIVPVIPLPMFSVLVPVRPEPPVELGGRPVDRVTLAALVVVTGVRGGFTTRER